MNFSQTTPSKSSPNPFLKYLVIVVVLFLLLIISVSLNLMLLVQKNSPSKLGDDFGKEYSLITDFTANVVGKITELNGKTLTVENKAGIKNKLLISENVLISILKPDLTPEIPSSDLKLIALNKEVSLRLELVSGKLEVTLISYLTPVANSVPTLPASDLNEDIDKESEFLKQTPPPDDATPSTSLKFPSPTKATSP